MWDISFSRLKKKIMDPLTLPLSVIEAAWNAVINARPELKEKVQALDGRVIQVSFDGLDRHFYAILDQGAVRLQQEWEGDADIRISGTPMALAALGAGEQARLFRGEVTIEGDAELGRSFREILDAIVAHWEAPLAGLVGEESAVKIRQALDEFCAWGAQTLDTVARDFAGYLQSDIEMLIDKESVVRFLDKVDVLRSDVDRLQARVARLQGHVDQ